MSAYRVALVALFVVGGTLVTAVPGAALPGDAGVTDSPVAEAGATDSSVLEASDERASAVGPRLVAQNASTNNSSLGADISSFMQSSAAEVGGAVETGMWTAAYNDTDNRSVRVQLVERQTADLREELTDLQERKAELVAEREAGNVSTAAYKARLGHLVGRINALRAALDATADRAREVNANVAAVAELQSETDDLSGPEIAAVARNTSGVGLGNGEGGPPGDVGNGTGNGVAGGSNGTTGPPADAGNGTSNASDSGPPSHANAPIVGDQSGSEGTAPGASATGPSPVTGDSSTADETSTAAESSRAHTAISATASTAGDLVEPVSDALAVRTHAFSYALTAA